MIRNSASDFFVRFFNETSPDSSGVVIGVNVESYVFPLKLAILMVAAIADLHAFCIVT